MSSCNMSMSSSGNANTTNMNKPSLITAGSGAQSHSQIPKSQQQLTTMQLQASRDLLNVEQEIQITVNAVKRLKSSKNDTWIHEHISLATNPQSSQSQSQSTSSSQQQYSSQQLCANIYPKFKRSTNYYQEFWRTYLMNEMMIAKIKEFSSENKILDAKIGDLEVLLREYTKLLSMKNKKKNRRTANEIEKTHICPYLECQKLYGSEVSLNLHIKLKHNGGNKTEREKLARTICIAQEDGNTSSNLELNLPPGFLHQFKEQFNLEKQKQAILSTQKANNNNNQPQSSQMQPYDASIYQQGLNMNNQPMPQIDDEEEHSSSSNSNSSDSQASIKDEDIPEQPQQPIQQQEPLKEQEPNKKSTQKSKSSQSQKQPPKQAPQRSRAKPTKQDVQQVDTVQQQPKEDIPKKRAPAKNNNQRNAKRANTKEDDLTSSTTASAIITPQIA